MLYNFVKIFARLAIRICCRDIKLNNKWLFYKCKGPLLLAVNHPNSFLDAIILCTLFNEPVYSLARGDAFKGKLISRILAAFKMLPVYRASEGVENLEDNYKTFNDCSEIFKQNGIVLIFSEGKCINEWHLRPLKKGTARLAIAAWQQNVPLRILPIGINYSSFNLFGKNVHINTGKPIEYKNMVNNFTDNGRLLNEVTNSVQMELQNLVYEIDLNDKQQLAGIFYVPVNIFKKLLLVIPAAAGWLVHYPLYFAVKKFIEKKGLHSDHHDAVMFCLLFLLYPFYLAGWALVLYILLADYWWALSFIIWPFTAWCYVQVKQQTDK